MRNHGSDSDMKWTHIEDFIDIIKERAGRCYNYPRSANLYRVKECQMNLQMGQRWFFFFSDGRE